MRVVTFGVLFVAALAFVAVAVLGVAVRLAVFVLVLLGMIVGLGWLLRKLSHDHDSLGHMTHTHS